MRTLGLVLVSGGLSAIVAYVVGREHGMREGAHDAVRTFYQERQGWGTSAKDDETLWTSHIVDPGPIGAIPADAPHQLRSLEERES